MLETSRRVRSVIAGLAVSVVVAGAAIAAASTDIIKTRQQGLKDMGAAAKVIRDELKGTPDLEKIKDASAKIQKTADEMANWFPSGSGPEAGDALSYAAFGFGRGSGWPRACASARASTRRLNCSTRRRTPPSAMAW